MAQPTLTEEESDARIAAALGDIQRLVVSAYAHLPWARYLLLRVDGGEAASTAARAWLATLIPQISTAAAKPTGVALNVAFTAEGLARLGVGPAALATFSRAFREGMAGEYRSRVLGDTGAGAPDRWRWGYGPRAPHVLLTVFAASDHELTAAATEHVERAAAAGVRVDERIDSMLLPNGVEHFGFTDGISQPVLAGTEWAQRTGAPRWESIAPGEFVLGQRDESGFVAEGPRSSTTDLGFAGSYLVMRQLEQHVEAFREYCERAASARGRDAAAVAAELVGRHRDGRSLAAGAPQSSDPDAMNDFGYELDKEGLGCPLGAHVRRANPRNSTPKQSRAAEATALASANRHRILRRGRPYGPLDETRLAAEPRGLVFVALNADIERQFEFVQHTWLNNTTFAGLSDERDPITAEQPTDDAGGLFTIPQRPVRDRLHGLPSFTTTRGGAYFFLPGVGALGNLARGEL